MPTTDTDYSCHRTYLTNCIGFISHHITPLVIYSLGGGHTRIQTFANRSNSKKPGAPGFLESGLKSFTTQEDKNMLP